MLSTAAFEKMKTGVRIINCARGELVDEKALKVAMDSGKVAGAALDVFEKEPPVDDPILTVETLVATPHIGGSTEEAQETVGVRIVEQLIEYLKNGVAINAVNIPALTAEQYRTVGPYVELADRLGSFAAHIAVGNPSRVRLVYQGKIADQKTVLIRNAGVAGVLSRSTAVRTNTVNAMQLADDRGLTVAEVHEHRADHTDSVRLELETDRGTVTVEGAVVLDQPRLISVDGIYCEAPLAGHLVFLQNQDVPGVIGYVGSVLGKNGVNIATFSLGRRSAQGDAVSVIATDQSVSEAVLQELLKNPAVKRARTVEFLHAAETASA
jgi:D-3-phosphoglycerate dehydrogenase